ncbi:MAG: M14 family metallopeptidase [Pseudomonadota bacterium]
MKKWLFLAATAFLFNSEAYSQKYFYVEVPFKTVAEIGDLRARGLDVAGVNFETHSVSLVMTERDLNTTRDLGILRFTEALRPDEEYKNPSEVEALLVDYEKNFPDLVRRESIGKSHEGRDIWAVALTQKHSKVQGPKKAIVVDAMHHAREVMTTEVAIDIIDYLTTHYESDSKVRNWMDQHEIWVVPMLNPDGNHKVWSEDTMWRKNARGGYGVDVNRNYPFGWAKCNGSSGFQFADTYRGPSEGSEPETQALMALISLVKPKFNLSFHSYSELVIYPFGCDPDVVPEPDAKIYLKTAKEFASKLVRDSGSGTYKAGTAYDLLYNVDGGSIDWMYGKEKVMAFVVELNGSSQGFQPDYKKWRDSTVNRQRAGWMYLLDQMAAPGIK